MTDLLYKQFVKRWEEVTNIPPQQLGPLTPFYKSFVKHLKVMPWPMLVVGSVVVVSILYLLIGSTVAAIVSILQRGF